nr:zinc finger protein 93-like isoform X2 [Onthophagus taurus]
MENIQSEKEEQHQETLLVNVVPAQILRFDMVCRVCGNENEKNIQIFGADGQNYELALKMNTYLPIKVAENDRLPTGCCWTCASAIISWHDLIVTSIETDRKIRALQIVLAKPLTIPSERTEGECEPVLNHRKETTEHKHTSLSWSKTELTVLNQLEASTGSTQVETSISNQNDQTPSTQSDSSIQSSTTTTKLAFNCELCKNKYLRKFDLKKHMLHKHSTNKSETTNSNKKNKRADLTKFKVMINDKAFYQCDLCENRYEHGYNLTRHKLKHSNGPKPHTCDVCGRRYSTKSGLKRHHDETHTAKRYVCKICNGEFRAKVTLTQHMNIHTNTRPFVCDVCEKSFRQESSLRVHKLYHSNTNFRFKCEICAKKYRRNCELKVHMTLHTGLKAYNCELCGKSFRLKNTLKKHVKLHDRLDVCRCDVCGASFNQLRYLNNHKKTHNVDT